MKASETDSGTEFLTADLMEQRSVEMTEVESVLRTDKLMDNKKVEMSDQMMGYILVEIWAPSTVVRAVELKGIQMAHVKVDTWVAL